jgi:hypothetical protein
MINVSGEVVRKIKTHTLTPNVEKVLHFHGKNRYAKAAPSYVMCK